MAVLSRSPTILLGSSREKSIGCPGKRRCRCIFSLFHVCRDQSDLWNGGHYKTREKKKLHISSKISLYLSLDCCIPVGESFPFWLVRIVTVIAWLILRVLHTQQEEMNDAALIGFSVHASRFIKL